VGALGVLCIGLGMGAIMPDHICRMLVSVGEQWQMLTKNWSRSNNGGLPHLCVQSQSGRSCHLC